MGRFGSDPEKFFTSVYRERAPWDIGAPQAALERLLEQFPPADPVLDIGCGSGDLAIWLATLGHTVLGIDFIPAPISLAEERRALQPAEVQERLRFQVADALRPSALRQTFGSVVDSGFFHLFDPPVGRELVDDLRSVLPPGGRYYMLEFGTEFPVENTPRAVPPAELHALFTPERGWRLIACESATFQSHIAPVPATCAVAERLPD